MSKKMLIVDDDETIRMCISKYCKENGLESTAVENGAQAIESAKANKYDAIIVDFGLDDMTGADVLQKIKDNGQVIENAILMSGTPDMDYQSKGFKFFLEKPIKKTTFKEYAEKIKG